MNLSIIVICWNDWKVLDDCLRSIFEGTHKIEYEVIVSDNGSTDGSVERIRTQFPGVRILENRANLGFAKGNNVGIREARGDYVLILNPDTIIHDGSLDRWIEFAERHPEAGAFGCLVLNPNGTYQESARPFPTISRSVIAALYLRPLRVLGRVFESDTYRGWKGDTEREVDWQSGCCVLFRSEVLEELRGFDERFFYHYEECDLCYRVRKAGHPILFTPEASITHLGGQSVGRFPLRFALERNRNRYRYFEKHFGKKGVLQCRSVLLLHMRVRAAAYRLMYLVKPSEALKSRLESYRIAIQWNKRLNPIAFVDTGAEPEIDSAATAQ